MDEQSSSASRFFYQAKVSKAERNMGLDDFEDVRIKTNISGLDDKPRIDGTIRETPVRKNTHPTVKPINLMTYLCRLITPEGGIVLDPFMGSGSTGISARLEGFRFLGMEMDEDYFEIAKTRIENYEMYRKFLK
jgi:site-specific DNA-methyltransferase (adenine-specific)